MATRNKLSLFLLLCLSLVIIPNEYLHAIYGHEDTECHSGPDQGFNAMHRHCKILQHHFSIFSSDSGITRNFTVFHYRVKSARALEGPEKPAQFLLTVRGPPLTPFTGFCLQ
jgi:hypothetical protein